MTAYYFGCVRQVGHHWYTPDLMLAENPESLPLVDAVFSPCDSDKEGLTQLVYLNVRSFACTLLSFWDRTVDNRLGSNSNFLLKGLFSFDDSVSLSKISWPSIWGRFSFEVVRWSPKI